MEVSELHKFNICRKIKGFYNFSTIISELKNYTKEKEQTEQNAIINNTNDLNQNLSENGLKCKQWQFI